METEELTARVLLSAKKKGLVLTIEEKNFLEGVQNGKQNPTNTN